MVVCMFKRLYRVVCRFKRQYRVVCRFKRLYRVVCRFKRLYRVVSNMIVRLQQPPLVGTTTISASSLLYN